MDFLVPELLDQFRQICHERISTIRGSLQCEENSVSLNRDKLAIALRELHTLKGEAGMINLDAIAKIVQTIEDKLYKVQADGRWTAPLEELLSGLDTISHIIDSKVDPKHDPEHPLVKGVSTEELESEKDPQLRNMDFITLKLLQQFRGMCQERVAKISKSILDSPEPGENLRNALEELHTLKGEAGMLEIPEVCEMAHTIENQLQESLKQNAWMIPVERLLSGLDVIQSMVEARSGQKILAPKEIQTAIDRLSPPQDQEKDISRGMKQEKNSGLPETEKRTLETLQQGSEEMDELTRKLIAQFREISRERLAKISELLLSDKSAPCPGAENLRVVFADLHTLKGEAGMLDLKEIAAGVHEFESRLKDIQRQEAWSVSPDILLVELDRIRELMETAAGNPRESETSTKIEAQTKSSELEKPPSDSTALLPSRELTEKRSLSQETKNLQAEEVSQAFETSKRELKSIVEKRLATGALPIEVSKLESLSAHIEKVAGDLIFFTNFVKKYHRNADHIKDALSLLKKLKKGESQSGPLKQGLKDLTTMLKKSLECQESFREQCSNLVFDLETCTEELILENLELRLMPLSMVVQHFHRGVYRIAREIGKEVKLVTGGLDTSLDRNILERFIEPVIHIIRNAIDHGIENPKQRQACGKNRQGTISFQARGKGREVEILIADDGRGIDLDKIADKAVEKGMISPLVAKELSDSQKMELIFFPDFSTREQVGQISGRGIGLDIVKKTIEIMEGKIGVSSKKGLGTTFTIQLPITLAKLSALLVRVGELFVCIPNYYVEEVKYISPADMQSVVGGKTISFRDRSIPLEWLHEQIGLPPSKNSYSRLAVTILKIDENSYSAFIVDSFMGEREIILKPFNRFLKKYRIFSAATLLDEGKIAYLLNVGKLSQETQTLLTSFPVKTRKRIMVVEDSPITREMEKTILESYGYDVTEAENGRVALKLLEETKPDLLISDIEMPELGGLELTKTIRREKKYDFPVIIVSTRGSPEDKIAGMEAGADAYLLKGEFHNKSFIETVEKWL